MGGLPVSDELAIRSHRGQYTARFGTVDEWSLTGDGGEVHRYLVDANVARLHADRLAQILHLPATVILEATEENKSLDRIIPVIECLVDAATRRDDVLVAVGGGIVQDITCFIASTLLRGLRWRFIPTTLLAQADSCIGSKSSINLGATKNILGTFNPPEEILIDPSFLETLGPADLRSGIGEIIKVHVIDGPSSFAALAADFPRLMDDPGLLLEYIRSSLLIKKRFIEEDEFDRGPRNVMNYGHSFGHAIESATAFEIPHGIAVTIGMDMANHVAHARGDLHRGYRDAVHQVCEANYRGFLGVPIPEEALFDALSRDKKNVGSSANLILPTGPNASMAKVGVVIDDEFREQCRSFLVGLGR